MPLKKTVSFFLAACISLGGALPASALPSSTLRAERAGAEQIAARLAPPPAAGVEDNKAAPTPSGVRGVLDALRPKILAAKKSKNKSDRAWVRETEPVYQRLEDDLPLLETAAGDSPRDREIRERVALSLGRADALLGQAPAAGAEQPERGSINLAQVRYASARAALRGAEKEQAGEDVLGPLRAELASAEGYLRSLGAVPQGQLLLRNLRIGQVLVSPADQRYFVYKTSFAQATLLPVVSGEEGAGISLEAGEAVEIISDEQLKDWSSRPTAAGVEEWDAARRFAAPVAAMVAAAGFAVAGDLALETAPVKDAKVVFEGQKINLKNLPADFLKDRAAALVLAENDNNLEPGVWYFRPKEPRGVWHFDVKDGEVTMTSDRKGGDAFRSGHVMVFLLKDGKAVTALRQKIKTFPGHGGEEGDSYVVSTFGRRDLPALLHDAKLVDQTGLIALRVEEKQVTRWIPAKAGVEEPAEVLLARTEVAVARDALQAARKGGADLATLSSLQGALLSAEGKLASFVSTGRVPSDELIEARAAVSTAQMQAAAALREGDRVGAEIAQIAQVNADNRLAWAQALLPAAGVEEKTAVAAAGADGTRPARQQAVGHVLDAGLGWLRVKLEFDSPYQVVAEGLDQTQALLRERIPADRIVALVADAAEKRALTEAGFPGDNVLLADGFTLADGSVDWAASRRYAWRVASDWLRELEGVEVTPLRTTARTVLGLVSQMKELLPLEWQKSGLVTPESAETILRLYQLGV